MKKLFFVFVLFSYSFLIAQSADQKKILEDSQSFMTLLKDKNYDEILNLTHPAIFDKIDKETMISGFKALLAGNEEFKIEITDPDKNAFNVSEVFTTKEKTRYAFCTYPMTMKMTFLKEKFDDEKKKMMTGMMEMQGMKSKFLDDSTLELSKESMIIAINDESTGNVWKYVNYDETNFLFASIMPVEVMEKAKEYYADFLIQQKEQAK
ncbi:hypothetical protein HNP38_003326 [Chryseobacterium defluvii]|uniref:DUF4163 domain-containing protein n=1 Tax=Chryseobacterium defluvii TaxID=160396 RepID=A0A840KFL9_9FLAO|nr:hypothetical protein [Chryseobacterium defluvii]MBB4807986.1 hypothetical protein [Chryseobacterium defluvii]